MRENGVALSILMGLGVSLTVLGATARAAHAAETESAETAKPAVASPGTSPATFEAVIDGAVPVGDLGTLLTPFAGKCDGETRDLDRVRCQTTRAYLRRVIPHQSFWSMVDDPMALTVSEFDGSIKGYHLSIAGCLACVHPVTVGRQKEERLVTLKAPDKGAGSLRAGVELGHNAVAFDNLGEAKSWLKESRNALRMQVVFQPNPTEWTYESDHGYALTMLGMRVFNRCTGEILVSRPPSTGEIELPGLDQGCRQDSSSDDTDSTRAANLPPELSKSDIEQAMKIIRPQVFACFEKFKVPGMASFEFVVASNGSVNTVRLDGQFQGTPTGACLLEAAQNARFASFSHERQKFSYPFFLRQ